MTTTLAVQLPDGHCQYLIPQAALPGTVTPKDPSVTVTRNLHCQGQYFVLVDSPAPLQTLTLVQRHSEATGMFASEIPELRSPITAAEFEALSPAAKEHYVRQYDYLETDVEVDLPATVAIPSVPPAVPRNWQPGVIGVLGGPLVAAIVPGVLTGYRAAVIQLCKAYGDCFARDNERDSIRVSVRSYWDPPRYSTTGKGRNKHTVQTHTTVHVELPDVPSSIAGRDLAHAQQLWDAGLAAIVDQLEGTKGRKICCHCNGAGSITLNTKETP